MEIAGDRKYKAMIDAGHFYIPMPVVEELEYDDGLGKIFDEVPPATATGKEGEKNADIPVHSDSPLVPGPGEGAEQKTEAPEPLKDMETLYKFENMTKEGIMEMLAQREVQFSREASKQTLHQQFMDSMKPVGVEMGSSGD